jgi:hypothetical protein
MLALEVVVPADSATAAGAAKAFVCEFDEGGAWAWEASGYAAKPVERFAFEIRAIDAARQTAELRRGERTSPLKIVQAVGASHFIEVAIEGFLNLTTVYELDQPDAKAKGIFPAAHSRHFAVLGEPLVSQYRGLCKPR